MVKEARGADMGMEVRESVMEETALAGMVKGGREGEKGVRAMEVETGATA